MYTEINQLRSSRGRSHSGRVTHHIRDPGTTLNQASPRLIVGTVSAPTNTSRLHLVCRRLLLLFDSGPSDGSSASNISVKVDIGDAAQASDDAGLHGPRQCAVCSAQRARIDRDQTARQGLEQNADAGVGVRGVARGREGQILGLELVLGEQHVRADGGRRGLEEALQQEFRQRHACLEGEEW